MACAERAGTTKRPNEWLSPGALAGVLLVLAADAGLYVRRIREADKVARAAAWAASGDGSDSPATAPRTDA